MSGAFKLDASQERAVELALSVRVGIITGGPGTGKSTCLRAAFDRLDAQPEPDSWDAGGERIRPYVLAAPTGKAARRMQEATGRAAVTVHRLLEYGRGGASGFARDARNPIPALVVVVDESSMLDLELMAALVDAIDLTRTRLILVGDANQLPPVGAGCPFAELIAWGRVPVARLTTLHRAAAESWVCREAPRVLQGIDPDLRTRPDFRFVLADIAGHVVGAVERQVGLLVDAGLEAQVLAPQHDGAAGVITLNGALQRLLNPKSAEVGVRSWGHPDERIYEGDRVIQTRNDYELDVMNGEVGQVQEIRDAVLVAHFDDRDVEYSREKAKGLHLAYALTTHKSQGSEWPWVVVVVHSTHTMMLTRALLYTAITRARQGVVIVGDKLGLQRAVANAKDARRNTSLVWRLEEGA